MTLFGPPRIQTETTTVVSFGTRRVVLLLAILASEPRRRFSRVELADRLWPGQAYETTDVRLRQEITRLRKLLGPSEAALTSEVGGLALDCSSDVDRFKTQLEAAKREPDPAIRRERLTDAIRIASARFLDGFAEQADERRRLTELKVGAAAELRDAASQNGRFPEALRWARIAADEDPLAEKPNLALARILSLSGQTIEALRELETYAQRLQTEIGLEPSSATRELIETLRHRASSGPPLPRTLPVELTRLFGREEEICLVQEALQENRLVTLSGPGGVGKTRLAVGIGARLEEDFEGRVIFVPLADLRDGRAILTKVAQQIGAQSIVGREDFDLLIASLPPGPTLAVLDNLEHLGPSATEFIAEFLRRKPNLKALVTSRHVLGLVGERVIRLAPLPLPAEDESLNALETIPSVALFIERARNASGTFTLGPENAGDVAQLVRRLSGLPLAIHLAASRTHILTPAQMLAQLDRYDDLLVGRGTEFATDRHRSLRAAMEWSLDLMDDASRRFLADLTVFVGGWTSASAAEVCAEPSALARIEDLIDRSLIEPVATQGGIRFRMLEPIREIAGTEAEADLRRRHAEHYIRAADEAFFGNYLHDRKRLLEWFDTEHDNLRAVLTFGVETQIEFACQAFAILWRYWCIRGFYEEARRWAEAILPRLEASTDPIHLTRTFAGLAILLRDQGDHIAAIDYLQRSIAASLAAGSKGGEAFARNNLSVSLEAEGRYAECVESAAQALRLFEDGIPHGVPIALTHMASGYRGLGERDHAFDLTLRALALAEASGEAWGIGDGNYNHSLSLLSRECPEEALNHLDVALERFREIEEIDNQCRVQMKRGEICLALNRGEEGRTALHDAHRLALLIGNPTRIRVIEGLLKESQKPS